MTYRPPDPGDSTDAAVGESSSVLYIPDDLIFKILARLPAKSVIRLRSVYKAWLAMTSTRRFVDAHLEFSKARPPTTLVLPREYHVGGERNGRKKTAFWIGLYKYNGGDVAELVHDELLPAGVAPWAPPLHCDGLILSYTRELDIMVCNPATKEFVSLPKGIERETIRETVGFGRDPSTNMFKVARYFFERKHGIDNTYSSRFEVLTLGTCNNPVWRRIAGPPHWIDVSVPGFHSRGFIYRGVEPRSHHKVLVSFSLADETFSEMPYPPGAPGVESYLCLLELEGELCAAFIAKPCEAAEIWTWDNTDLPAWKHRCTIPLPKETIRVNPSGRLRHPKLNFLGKDLQIIGDHKLYRYSIETGEIKKADVAIEELWYFHPEKKVYHACSRKEVVFHTVNYVESLVKIRGHNSSLTQRVVSVLARIFVRTWNLITNGWAEFGRYE
ncbi:hypothetical protein ACP70R_012023 [Stipagrostis hirtigluma subsp. patula]